ncbi:MAG: ribose-5-phosphate isomerase RpiA [Candidatus Asgardarchaeia archaeon]
MSDVIQKAKENASKAALSLVEDGQVIGVGSGSTVRKFIELLGEYVTQNGISIHAVPSSLYSEILLRKFSIPTYTLWEYPEIDLTIDGADEVDGNLNLIKGGGGSHTREKIVAYAAKKFIVIVDFRKVVDKLGSRSPVPVEVIPFSTNLVIEKLRELGADPKLRMAEKKFGPVVTDNGNFIVDAKFQYIEDPHGIDIKMKEIPGVVETGLFVNMADTIFVGYEDRVEEMRKR